MSCCYGTSPPLARSLSSYSRHPPPPSNAQEQGAKSGNALVCSPAKAEPVKDSHLPPPTTTRLLTPHPTHHGKYRVAALSLLLQLPTHIKKTLCSLASPPTSIPLTAPHRTTAVCLPTRPPTDRSGEGTPCHCSLREPHLPRGVNCHRGPLCSRHRHRRHHHSRPPASAIVMIAPSSSSCSLIIMSIFFRPSPPGVVTWVVACGSGPPPP